ncbi:MAG: methyltransferase [Alphaproteobacteria bacterium]|nr:methyltransferase [Alphaproteobacteria bacterium]
MRSTVSRSSVSSVLAVALLLGVAGCNHMNGKADAASIAPVASSAHIVAAVKDPARPAADTAIDADRKPDEMLAFAGVTPGMKIGELIPGGGYMTRVFSKAIGPTGKLYAFAGPVAEGRPPVLEAVMKEAATYPNVSVVTTDFVTVKSPEPLDLVWTSQNYHDLHNPGRNIDLVAANKQVFNALKPGGTYIVLDHSAPVGAGTNSTTHRIEPELVKKEVLAAGFEYVGDSNVLRNPADPRDKTVFDPSIRRKTDQFILKFRKPA